MRLHHADYIKLVIGLYKRKRNKNELSVLLSQPTPASIRQECAHVYKERYEKKDEPVLRAFFGPGEHGRQFLGVIENFDLAKFKPIDQYLKKDGNKGLTDKSLELVAWLIDFRHRPYVYGKELLLSEEELLIIQDKPGYAEPVTPFEEPQELPGFFPPEEEKDSAETRPAPLLITIPPKKNWKKRSPRTVSIFLGLVAGIATLSGIAMLRQVVKPGNTVAGCMYWTGEQYAKISCSGQRTGLLVLPMDSEKMKNFKRITREDTITEKSIGNIYYIRLNGGREYYTAAGNHPVYVTRPLQVFSRYIYETHHRNKVSPGKELAVEAANSSY
ncbi:hypothetical protein [Flavihumibacter sp. CACIAM 22H1]|uniref:hypothetical protein n=1 Tax=Flavihumibacter sp. CACIAM 22H1 TaxID=1812911 RepID=UPI0007A92F7A|nr:hypothetical protein [Flavihumibacter sp. CACIAM 22H1]KYP14140.1 MAG: hypothetical protein A1D16_20015 [Flavihumibacter sp. CACIAM 22H1]